MLSLPSRARSLSKRSLSLCLGAIALVALGAAFALVSGPAEAADHDVYVVDTGHSTLQFKVSHLGFSYTYGRFNEFNGSFKYNKDNPSGCAVDIDCSTESIDSNDEGRDKHLRNADYFNCEKFPSMTFKSTKIEMAGSEYRVTGNLTLLGKTNEVTMRMKKIGEGRGPYNKYRMGFEGNLVIKRSDYGMTTMLPKIGDEVYITLGIEGIKHEPSAKK